VSVKNGGNIPLKYSRFMAGLLALLLAACGQAPEKRAGKDPRACFPAEARRWIALKSDADKPAPKVEAKATRDAVIYVDRSGSMEGYLAGATNTERPFHDIVSTLAGSLAPHGFRTHHRSFGTTVSENLPDGGSKLLDRASYRCPQAGACDNSESRLDRVFAQIKSTNSPLSVVVTDLWFTNSDIQSSGIAALQPLLTDLLFADKVVAIYAIAAPFSGKIYDLPDAGTDKFSVPYAGRHPLYMVVVGDKSAIVDFEKGVRGGGSNYLAAGLENGTIKQALFAIDPGPESPAEAAPLSAGTDPAVRVSNFQLPPGVAVQRFLMRPGRPTKAAARVPEPPSWAGPKASAFLPGAIWQGPINVRTLVWKKSGEACSDKSWLRQNVAQTGWKAPRADGAATFTLAPDAFRGALSQKGTYLITGEVQRSSVTVPNPQNMWMRGPWNLTPEAAGATAGSAPGLFPTLNLSEFGRIMENALATAVERKDQPITGFTVLVKVED